MRYIFNQPCRYNDQHRHSGQADAICQKRARVYEQAWQRNPRRWSRISHRWRQPAVAWINPPPSENGVTTATFLMAA
jgi:putative transposase